MTDENKSNISHGLNALLPVLPKEFYWQISSDGISINSSHVSDWSQWLEFDLKSKITPQELEKYAHSVSGIITPVAGGNKFRYEVECKAEEVKPTSWLSFVRSSVLGKKPKEKAFYRFRMNEIFVMLQPEDENGNPSSIIRDNLVETANSAYAIWMAKQLSEFSSWLNQIEEPFVSDEKAAS